jgi:hypothetical protein
LDEHCKNIMLYLVCPTFLKRADGYIRWWLRSCSRTQGGPELLSRERPRIEYANGVVEIKIGSRIQGLFLSRISR